MGLICTGFVRRAQGSLGCGSLPGKDGGDGRGACEARGTVACRVAGVRGRLCVGEVLLNVGVGPIE